MGRASERCYGDLWCESGQRLSFFSCPFSLRQATSFPSNKFILSLLQTGSKEGAREIAYAYRVLWHVWHRTFTPDFKCTKNLNKTQQYLECKQKSSMVVLISSTHDIWYLLFVCYALFFTPCNARHGKTGNAMPSTIQKIFVSRACRENLRMFVARSWKSLPHVNCSTAPNLCR